MADDKSTGNIIEDKPNHRKVKKVLIITYYWPPSGGPGVQRWLKFVKYLPQFGYEPVVLTVNPDAATYPVRDISLLAEVPENLKVYHTQTREPYYWYQKLTGKQQVPYSGFSNEPGDGFFSKLSRFVRGNLFIPDARVGWNRYAIAKAADLINSFQIELLITTSPPHSTQLAGLEIKKQFPGIKWIADLRDPWTDIFYYDKMLHLPFVKRKDLKLEKQVLQNADAVITVSKFVRKLFQKKMEFSVRNKIELITNGFDPEDFAKKDYYPDNEYFTIAYVGTLADSYDLSGFINSLENIKEFWTPKLRVRFTGSVSDYWKSRLSNHLGEMVSFSEHVDHQQAIHHMQSADMLLLVIPRIAHNEGIVTGKIFEYIAALRPVLGIGPQKGDAAALLDSTSTGKVFDYHESQKMTSFILQHAGKEKDWFPNRERIAKFSRIAQTEKLVHIMRSLTQDNFS